VNPARQEHASRQSSVRRRLVALAVLCPLVLLAAASLGAVRLGPSDLWSLLTGSGQTTELLRTVFWDIRLPRVLLAALVGASLALAGAGVQGLFRNPLADPALIGVSAGAAVGAVLCFFFGWALLLGGWLLPLMAFVGGLLAVLVLRLFNTGVARGGPAKFILAGVALNAMLGSVLGFFLFSASDDALRSMTFWTLGSCASARWPQVVVLAVSLAAGAVLLGRHARALDALQLGEDQAAHLGVAVRRVRRETIVAAALMVGAATAFAGTIGFIGLVAPHMARLLLGGRHRLVLPGALLLGAMLLVLADLGARTLVAPAELAVGILTAAIGGPFFLWLLRRPSSWSAS
jgi:iron complex transport system permease protein